MSKKTKGQKLAEELVDFLNDALEKGKIFIVEDAMKKFDNVKHLGYSEGFVVYPGGGEDEYYVSYHSEEVGHTFSPANAMAYESYVNPYDIYCYKTGQLLKKATEKDVAVYEALIDNLGNPTGVVPGEKFGYDFPVYIG